MPVKTESWILRNRKNREYIGMLRTMNKLNRVFGRELGFVRGSDGWRVCDKDCDYVLNAQYLIV